MTNYEDVKNMYEKFGFTLNNEPVKVDHKLMTQRVAMMQEELDELDEAVFVDDFPDQVDALIDLVYFALGTAAIMGIPWQELWDDVHRANMTKEIGVTKRGITQDLRKPEGWKGPKTLEILKKHGYRE